MASKALNFETGIVDYEVNGCAHVRFNPTDVAFVERLYDTFNELDSRQDEFQKRVDAIGEDKQEMFVYARERDREMREIIDGLFEDGLSDALFPNMNCYALADGMPIWINFMFAIAEEVRDSFTDQQTKMDPRLKRFDAKHEELLRKYKKATTK